MTKLGFVGLVGDIMRTSLVDALSCSDGEIFHLLVDEKCR